MKKRCSFKASNVWYEPGIWEPSGREQLPCGLVVAEEACYLVIAVSAVYCKH